MNTLFQEYLPERTSLSRGQKLVVRDFKRTLFFVFLIVILAVGASTSSRAEDAATEAIRTELRHLDIKTLIARAESGDVEAQNQLGIRYELGRGIAQDHKSAMTWYMKAAEGNLAGAMANVGRLYAQGLGAPKDEQLALTWMQKGADLGSADAQNYVGWAYATGAGYKQDYQKAFDYYTKAADSGNSNAQNNLAHMYANGQFVSLDFRRAGELYGKALQGRHLDEKARKDTTSLLALYARKCSSNVKPDGVIVYDLDSCFAAISTGDPAVLHAVGIAYHSGEASVDRDYAKAFHYITLSAKLRFPSAQVHLATMYDEGLGTPINLVEAYAWYATAETQPGLVTIQRELIEVSKKYALKHLGLIDDFRAKSKAKQYIKLYGFNAGDANANHK